MSEPGARPLTVAMISSEASRQGANAITDYVQQLAGALAGVGVTVHPVVGRDWGVRGLLDLRRAIARLRPDVVHIQHPVSFEHRSLVPQIVSILKPGVVTLHGGSRYGWLGARLSLGPFFLRSRRLIFTTTYERDHALSWSPWVHRRVSVIPIGANLPSAPSATRNDLEIVNFGLIRRDKGIEDVIELARLLYDEGLPWRIRIIGQVPDNDRGYAEALRRNSAHLPVEWVHDLDHEAAAGALGRARAAYLPFPDGASDRRGSLLACLGAGNAVVTTTGAQTAAELAPCVRFAASPREALTALRDIVSGGAPWAALSAAALAYAERFAWSDIAARHRKVYERIARP